MNKTMDVRGKLVRLLVNSPGLDTLHGDKQEFSENADWLISHGVTVQEWISVKDRLPEDYRQRVLVKINDANNIIGHPDMDTDRYSFDLGFWIRWGENVTHWMPLPEPPKE